jgi:CheY-like chemotaxis protein
MVTETAMARPTVLVVDDDEAFARGLAVILRAHFDVVTAVGSQEAIDLCAELRPNTAILDLHMPACLSDDPEVEGALLVNELRRVVDPDLPVIIITRGVPSVLESSLSHQVDGIFTKPIRVPEIVEHVRRLVAGSKADESGVT